ncbi:MAG: hypothetical protein WC505_02055 [Patescibacteria group bacterium]
MIKGAFIAILLLLALPAGVQAVNGAANVNEVAAIGSGTVGISSQSLGIINFFTGYGMLVTLVIFFTSFYGVYRYAHQQKIFLAQHPGVTPGEVGNTDLLRKSRRRAGIFTGVLSVLLVSFIPLNPFLEKLFQNAAVGIVLFSVLFVSALIVRVLYAIRIRNFTELERTGHAAEHGMLYVTMAKLALWKSLRVASITLFALLLEVWVVVLFIS